jgi:hypothetical protein
MSYMRDDLEYNTHKFLQYAAANAHFPIIRYLLKESGQSVDAAVKDTCVFRYAAYNNHLPVVRYLIEDSNQLINVFANDNDLLRTATADSSLLELRICLETVVSPVEAVGLDLARELFKTQLSDTMKNTATVPMKGRI